MPRARENPDDDPALQRRLRIASELRESRAHQVAAALDEVLTLAIVVLAHAGSTSRGMQARRAKRLAGRFRNFRDSALEGNSPCQNIIAHTDIDNEPMENQDRLVR